MPTSHKQNAPRAQGWRDVLPVHPAAELFPLMSEAELRELGEDIKKHGLTSCIVLWSPACGSKEVCLIDGRNRLDAMELVGIDTADVIRPEEAAATHADPYAYVIAANIHRRHLSAEDKDKIIVAVLKAQPQKSNRRIAKETGTSHPHVAKIRQEAEKSGDVESVSTLIDSKGRKQPARKPKASHKAAQEVDSASLVSAGERPGIVLSERSKAKLRNTTQTLLDDLGVTMPPGFESLAMSWREVEAQAAAGNKPRLLTALKSHLEQVRRALKDWGEGVQ
jgi:DNA-binding Lrp family transcriptional regulator